MNYYKFWCKYYEKMVCGNPSKPQQITNQVVKTEEKEQKVMEKITITFVKSERKTIEKVFPTREECNAYYMSVVQKMRGVKTIVLRTMKDGVYNA